VARIELLDVDPFVLHDGRGLVSISNCVCDSDLSRLIEQLMNRAI
jgi:hypothetical protein